MGCIYIFNGTLFDSELELDDFLIEKHKYYTKYGDIVFSKEVGKLHAEDLLDKITKEAGEKEELNKIYREGKRIYDDDGKSIELKRPYIGVNDFLSKYKTIDPATGEEKLLFPEFREEIYWQNRFSAWAKGEYTEDEKDFFFKDEEPYAIKDRTQLEAKKKEMKDKWEALCLYGDAIHSVLETYFSKEGDNYIKDLGLTKEQFKLKVIEKAGSYKRADGSWVKFEDLINDRMFDEAYNKCKQIEQALIKEFGEDLSYYPEFHITGKIGSPTSDGVDTLLGKIDLLILDKHGIPHILDYKTSPKPFEKFNSAKKLAYTYQVAVYGKLLEKSGFNISKTKYGIIPIQLADFQKTDSGFTMSGLNLRPNVLEMEEVTSSIKTNNKIDDNLSDIMGTYIPPDITSDELLTNVHKVMRKYFPQYRQIEHYKDEQIRDDIEKNATFNEGTGMWEWKPEGSMTTKPKVAKSKVELFTKVKNYYDRQPKFLQNITQHVIDGLKKGIEQDSSEGIKFADQKYGDDTISTDWFQLKVGKYCQKGVWEVREDCDALTKLGIICLENKFTHQFDFIKICTGKNLKWQHNFGDTKHTSLLGAFLPDLYYQSRQKSLMLEGVNGNIELMETMAAINSLQGIFGDKGIVGNIEVDDPIHGYGVGASNKELMYCWNELHKHSKLEEIPNNFQSGEIGMASKAFLARTTFTDILTRANSEGFVGKYEKYKNFNSAKSMLDDAITSNDERKQLKELTKLAKELGKDQDKIITNQKELSEAHVQIYNQVLLAIAELRGIDYRQQLRDHDRWLESWAIHNKGLHGTYLDNPGNLQSETLNTLTKMVTEAYQGVRDDMMEPEAKIRKLVEDLKKSKNFGYITEHTTGNQASLYENLYEVKKDADGTVTDILFKNPDTAKGLKDAERNFLRYALEKINENRLSAADAEQFRLSGDARYYRIPLARGDSSSFAAKEGMLKALKDRLSKWSIKKAQEEFMVKALGIVDSIDDQKHRNATKLFEMTNMFDAGESKDRKDYLQAKGAEYFESNLETLLMKHIFAYSMKEHIDDIMPMIKASAIHLTMQGAQLNTEFKNDLLYTEEYIRNKIKNESIVNENFRKYEGIANKIKSASSTMVLAVSPVQAIYQTIQGVWNDISLILRKPDGTMAFTLANMSKAAKMVYSDLFHIGNEPTITQLLNEQYGVNDMDMNTYCDKLKSDLHGIYNFLNFLFKFTQRPDYYNRMTIFQSKMIADGCMEAHHINKDGMLEYNWKEDKRFDVFAKGLKNNPKYNEQAARYYAIAKQFELEHAKVKINGKYVDFELNMDDPMPLPKAYTNMEAESMKSLSDNIYGYYSHEKKSLIHSCWIGSLWMQFRTFWSGKKNQYLAGGGVRLEGKWKQYEENGQKYYYQVDPDGTIRYDLEPTTTETNAPVIRWEGLWQEGILSTVTQLASAAVHPGSSIHDMWYNPDENLRNTYRSNIYKLAYDFIMFAVIGSMISAALAGLYKKEKSTSGDSFIDGLKLAALNIATKSVSNSFMDFNFIDSIASPATSWTPFCFEYLGKQLSGVYNVALADDKVGKAWDFAVNTTSTGRQFKPIFDRIKPDTSSN